VESFRKFTVFSYRRRWSSGFVKVANVWPLADITGNAFENPFENQCEHEENDHAPNHNSKCVWTTAKHNSSDYSFSCFYCPFCYFQYWLKPLRFLTSPITDIVITGYSLIFSQSFYHIILNVKLVLFEWQLTNQRILKQSLWWELHSRNKQVQIFCLFV